MELFQYRLPNYGWLRCAGVQRLGGDHRLANDPTTSLLFPRAEDGIRLFAIRSLRGGTSPGGFDPLPWLSRGLAAWAARNRGRERRQSHALFYDPTLTKRVLHASVPSRGSPRREWIWRTRRAFNCCCQTFSRHTLCTSPLRAGVRYSLLEPQPMCSRTSWRFSMCMRAAGTSVLITSCRLRTRDSARGRSAMVDTFMGRMLQPAQSIHAGMRARGGRPRTCRAALSV